MKSVGRAAFGGQPCKRDSGTGCLPSLALDVMDRRIHPITPELSLAAGG
jgi:hypothetical protein